LVPDWLRFVKGVVDCDDIPLNLSREHLQESAIIKRLSGVLTRRLIKFLDKEASSSPERYEKFYNEFSQYFKEGVCTDYVHKEDIAGLLRMESSALPAGKLTSLGAYIERMPKEQTELYYLIVPSRTYAEHSPYYESFKERDVEVLFLYDTRLDDFVLSNLSEYKGKKMKTIESSSAADLMKEKKESDKGLTQDEFKDFARWVKDVLIDKVTTVTETDRLSNTPLIIVDHESASFRRMMLSVDPKNAPKLPKQQVQVNAKHSLILSINKLRSTEEYLAKEALDQIFDNALIQAGLIEDSRSMVPRINKLLQRALDNAAAASTNSASEAKEDSDDPFTAPDTEFKDISDVNRSKE